MSVLLEFALDECTRDPATWETLGRDEAIALAMEVRRLRGQLEATEQHVTILRSQVDARAELISRETFDAELGERMNAEGKFVIKTLLYEASVNGRRHCRFDAWEDRLKAEAYAKLNVVPVQMYRRVKS